jgi:uncharacterized protein
MTEDLIKKDFEIANPSGKIVDGYAIYSDNSTKKPLVLFQHGFKGFKDWGFFPYACKKFAEAGAFSICYNFSMNGMYGSSDLVVNPDDFAQMTISNLLADIYFIKNSFAKGNIIASAELEKHWNGKIYLVGHSLGGGLTIIAGRDMQDISAIATWASISKFDRYTERQKKFWKETGFAEITNSRTKQVLKLNVTYYEDIDQNREKYDIKNAVGELEISLLICHGTEDMTVRIEEAESLEKTSGKESTKLLRIPKTAHTFGAVHPFAGTGEALDLLIKETISFFEI